MTVSVILVQMIRKWHKMLIADRTELLEEMRSGRLGDNIIEPRIFYSKYKHSYKLNNKITKYECKYLMYI